jgi:hypothetical protein
MKQEQTGAVIVEVRGSKAAALTQSGEFIRVKNEGYTVGQQVLLIPQPAAAQPVRKRMRVTALAGMAAGFLLLVLGGFKGYTMPVGVVSLDVNPSIEYTINAFDRVLDITAVNDDAGKILANMDKNALRYRPVDEVVDATILALRENGYLTAATGNDVVIAASSYDTRHTERIAERLGLRVGQDDGLNVYAVPVSHVEVEDAHARGTSAGKLYIIEELESSWNSAEDFDADDWIERPVHDIIHETDYQREGGDGDDEGEDREWSTSSPYKTPTSQQSTSQDGNQQYQKSDSAEHEQESGNSPKQGEPKHD